MLSLTFIALALLAMTATTKWTAPTLLEDFGENFADLFTVYRDPATSVSHVIVGMWHLTHYLYLAVTDEGVVLHKVSFREESPKAAIIKGAGDGKHLFLAFVCCNRDRFNFTESADGGKTWSKPVGILAPEEKSVSFQDMVYVPETGRIYLFFIKYFAKEIWMMSRAPGSIIFSGATLVGKDAYPYLFMARASYTRVQSRTYLHVAYIQASGSAMIYTRSENSGVTWSVPKEIAQSESVRYVTGVLSDSQFGPWVYVTYVRHDDNMGRMIYSSDHGAKFSAPIMTTTARTYSDPAGMALCTGNPAVRQLASLLKQFISVPEFAIWNATTLKPEYRAQPYVQPYADTTGIDCAIDKAGKRTITTFAVIYDGYAYKLFAAADTEKL